LESPIGVGYSYINNLKDLRELSDQVVTIDNYDFLVGWFKMFPSYQSNDFYIIGESYGGTLLIFIFNFIKIISLQL